MTWWYPSDWQAVVWAVAAAAFFAALLAWLMRPARLPPPGMCWNCRYDCRGNESGKCTECGERI